MTCSDYELPTLLKASELKMTDLMTKALREHPTCDALRFLQTSCPKLVTKAMNRELTSVFGTDWFSVLGYENETMRSLWDQKSRYSPEQHDQLAKTIAQRQKIMGKIANANANANTCSDDSERRKRDKEQAEQAKIVERKRQNWKKRQQKKATKAYGTYIAKHRKFDEYHGSCQNRLKPPPLSYIESQQERHRRVPQKETSSGW